MLCLQVLPVIYHNRIHRELSGIINQEFKTDLTFSDFNISLLRSFPNLELDIKNMALHDGNLEPLKIGSTQLFFNFWKLLKDTLEIRNIIIRNASLVIITDEQGSHAKISRRDELDTAGKARSFILTTKDIEINDAIIHLENKIKQNLARIQLTNANLSMAIDKPLIRITGDAQGILDSLVSSGIVVFSKVPLSAEHAVYIFNTVTNEQEILNGTLNLHKLSMSPKLRITCPPEGKMIDLSITCENDLNGFLSLLDLKHGIPFRQVNPDARAKLVYKQKGFVDARQKPLTEIDAVVSNGVLESEKLPDRVTNLFLSGSYTSGVSHSAKTTHIIIDTIHAEMGNSHLEGRFDLLDLEDPVIDTRLLASIDLSKIIKPGRKITAKGIIDVNLMAKGTIGDFEKYHLAKKEVAKGQILVRDVALDLLDSSVRIKLTGGKCTIDNRKLTISGFDGTINDEEFQISGEIDKLDQLFFGRVEAVKSTLQAAFDKVDLEQLPEANGEDSVQLNILKYIPPNSSLHFNISAEEIKGSYGIIRNAMVEGDLRQDTLAFNKLNFRYSGFELESQGRLLFKKHTVASLTASANITGNKLILSDLLRQVDYGTENRQGSKGKIPPDIDLKIGLQLDTLAFRDLSLDHVEGVVALTEDDFHVANLKAHLFDGDAMIDFNLINYPGPYPEISGRLEMDFDTLRLGSIFESISNPSSKSQDPPIEKSIWQQVPGKFNFQFLVDAKHILSDTVACDSLHLEGFITDHKAQLTTFHLNIMDGTLDLTAIILRDANNAISSSINTNASNLNIGKVLSLFNNFGQTFLTSQNAHGTIAWNANIYLAFDSAFRRIDEKNLWAFNLKVPEAELSDVIPLEKALSFVRYKSKENILVTNLDFQAFRVGDELYFHHVIVKNSVSDMELFGTYLPADTALNLNIKLSLSDLFFKSLNRRLLETEGGIVDFGKGRDLNLVFDGTKEKHQLKPSTKRKYNINETKMSNQFDAFDQELSERVTELKSLFSRK